MGINDTAEFPWLKDERKLIKRLSEQHKPVLVSASAHNKSQQHSEAKSL